MLREQLAALREADFNLDVLGFDDQELARQLAEQERAAGFTDEDEVPDVPTAPVTRIGDLWLLGRREEQTPRNRSVGAHTRSASPPALPVRRIAKKRFSVPSAATTHAPRLARFRDAGRELCSGKAHVQDRSPGCTTTGIDATEGQPVPAASRGTITRE